jgi:FO synthase
MHAIARLSLSPYIENIQASWVKLGRSGAAFALNSGANDLGGTLMNESITRSAGAAHGEELDIENLASLVAGVKRHVRYRNTFYQDMSASQLAKARQAAALQVIELSDVKRGMKAQLLHPGESLDPRDSKVRT